MERLVAHGKDLDIKSLYDQYEALYIQALSLKGTVKKMLIFKTYGRLF